MLVPIQQDRITDVVYETLRQNILRRRFAAGERLHVDDLAKRLAVSRTPVREALNLLAAEGLVSIVPRSGTFVAQLSPRDLEEVFDIRICLEGNAAERVAERGLSAEVVAELRKIVASAASVENEEDRPLRHAEANRAFHRRIIELTGNRKLAQIYSSLNAHTMVAFVHYSTRVSARRWEMELAEHESIVAALERGDPEGARRAMEAHLRRGRDSLLADTRATTNASADEGNDQILPAPASGSDGRSLLRADGIRKPAQP